MPCLDWNTAVARYGPFDLVAIDVEGYDGDLLHQIDFSNRPPGIIIYEHRNLTRAMRRRCVRTLRREGYFVTLMTKRDTVAVCSRLVPALQAAIRDVETRV